MSVLNDEFDYQVLKLSDEFFREYPKTLYKEILEKTGRSYNCLLIQSHYDYFICVPYRTEISHKYAYRFKKSKRSLKHKSGLDYSKIVIIEKLEYIHSEAALVDQDEYNETRKNMNRIKREAMEFVDDYVAHMNGEKLLNVKEFIRRYKFSPLQYFHKQLKITEV